MRVTGPLLDVYESLLLSSRSLYGQEIMRATGLRSGTLYPILRRLEAAGLVEGTWEDWASARPERRPRRKFYRLTRAGAAEAAATVERYTRRS